MYSDLLWSIPPPGKKFFYLAGILGGKKQKSGGWGKGNPIQTPLVYCGLYVDSPIDFNIAKSR